jgi:16S rRNA A1518/A1519 N6-dimethyltransferase RsmA/KsgA/DIM1 with predicted DNA glycosylase/AP lyase activity
VLHSLLILKHIKATGLSKIVEVGCGYGGLFLAINHFSKILNIKISDYYFIDLPEITGLIDKYVNLHKDILHINFSTHSAYNYGLDVNNTNLFFISNYCFTEIDNLHQINYVANLFPKISNGFIIWQTVCVPINKVSMIGKETTAIVEEYPQTANPIDKNYYVYF